MLFQTNFNNSIEELIIAEKDQQAEDIANAISLNVETIDIPIPTEDFLNFEKRLRIINDKLKIKKDKLEELKLKYSIEKLITLKSYSKLLEEIKILETDLSTYQPKFDNEERNLKTYNIRYWKDNNRILVACTGHLLNIAFQTKKDLEKVEIDDSEDSESEINSDDELITKLRFDTKIVELKPNKDENINRYARFQFIKKIIKENSDSISNYVCWTDDDREGQSIFGTIIEYLGIDFNKCSRIKFSTLEESVLIKAYENPYEFDVDFYNSGKARRWLDIVIGFNLNPAFSKIYTMTMKNVLDELGINEETIDKQLLNFLTHTSFNMGRVKLVILKYIYDHTFEQIGEASTIETHELETTKKDYYELFLKDNSNIHSYFSSSSWLEKNTKVVFNYNDEIIANINKIEYKENYTTLDNREVPKLLNLTNAFNICRYLGANTNQINSILEYLYLQKYISYPRSKSDKWEMNDIEALKYSNSVLDALKDIGYNVKDKYYKTVGNQGDSEDAEGHPCIHPLPSVDYTKMEYLKNANPLAFLVFNEICIHTLKCFEELPKTKDQIIYYELLQPNGNIKINLTKTIHIELLETNILDYFGLDNNRYSISNEINVAVGNSIKTEIHHKCDVISHLESCVKPINMISDFDVINYLNESEIGTDATRTILLKELVELQYLNSPNVMLTTFLGDILSQLASNYVEFINEDYTIEMENHLNEIQNGDMDLETFENDVKDLLKTTLKLITEKVEEIQQVFLDNLPRCNKHEDIMILRSGIHGKFFQCPHFYLETVDNKEDKCRALSI